MLEVSTSVPTPSGFRELGSIHPGDLVYGVDGKAHLVEWESQVQFVGGYTITFDDGSTVTANDDHLWLTYDVKELVALTKRTPEYRARRRASRKSRAKANPQKGLAHQRRRIELNKTDNPSKPQPPPTGTARTTREIVDTLTVRNGRANHAIPVAQSLQLPEKSLLIDPYVLGAWLGDGFTANGRICGMDDAVFENVNVTYDPGSTIYDPDKGGGGYRVANYPQLKSDLDSLGLIGNKHVPHDYLWSSESQRLALLQGLLDTDGNVSKASVEFTNTNQDLTEGVAHLARSLGMKVTVRTRDAKCNGKNYGTVWTVKFAANRIVFRIPRKAEAQSISTRRTSNFRYIKSVERIKPTEMKCLKVSSPDSLFLVTENFIPTHNSEAALAAFAQYADVPFYKGIIFRRTFTDLKLPGALMDRSHEWWDNTEAKWKAQDHAWQFPSGAVLQFGFLEREADKLKYQGANFHYIMFDELTQFTESQYTYLFSRLRKLTKEELEKFGISFDIPLRMRSASNPGGPGHEWVKKRFIGTPEEPVNHPNRIFISSRLEDNPSLDQAEYELSLSELDPITRAQLRLGDWTADARGGMFKKVWFNLKEDRPRHFTYICRFWDLAATEAKIGEDPDYTVGLLYGLDEDGETWILDIQRLRESSATVERTIKATALADGPDVEIWMEQEPGASGKALISHYRRNILAGYTFRRYLPSGKKDVRARPVSGAAEEGTVNVIYGGWNLAFFDEVSNYPDSLHDDQIDALSGAHDVTQKVQRLTDTKKQAKQTSGY